MKENPATAICLQQQREGQEMERAEVVHLLTAPSDGRQRKGRVPKS